MMQADTPCYSQRMNSSLSEVAAVLVFALAGCAGNELPADTPRPSDDISGEYAEPVDQAKP